VPLGVAERAVEVAQIAEKLKPITNPNMKSDLTTAIGLATAALTGALANVEINLESLKDEAFVKQTRSRAAEVEGLVLYRRRLLSAPAFTDFPRASPTVPLVLTTEAQDNTL